MVKKTSTVVRINNGLYWTEKDHLGLWRWKAYLRHSANIYTSERGYKRQWSAKQAAESFGLKEKPQ